MRIGQVIGKVTMGVQDPALRATRWLLVNPLEGEQLNTACDIEPRMTSLPSLVVYDDLGAGETDIVGFVEGAEATAPFKVPTPIDAITVAIFDWIEHHPYPPEDDDD
ncbi:MAG: ethanolamine utilization protein EutN [Roseibacillus sp.]|jgi:microcompartment protein CcmK/EutM|nr:ethanolamine utilization protein EutN [Roseibacillus sp.]HAO95480.1 ethanolamine utilization protein EutN [Verrucomicrobiales bacterium]|tara:strand:- start:7899 stop:8219 length:321 start_codon:yes stop_codon:yes gene_type:complete